MKKLFLLFAVFAITVFLASFTANRTKKVESGYYFLYYQGGYTEGSNNNIPVKWIYISDVEYGERPNPTGLGAHNYSKIKQHFINTTKSKYSGQLSKYYIDHMSWQFKKDKEDLIQIRNKEIESAKSDGFKVFTVNL
ncbi:hypothetical protein [Epilithonimonas xixisoli]|uniref:Uncharacterized protein n=1 Tax=Epilithonimonas xixisoli TaxID=1476462 RepID=A0A4R8I4S9_9FLAO|nr:hypothetical protein [Epilithonimonas xixisoli]TDX83324.1 hypothetical protein B0I22_3404 [Epilithonimonas xixisoli]